MNVPNSFGEWVAMQGRVPHTPTTVDELLEFHQHAAELKNAQEAESDLGAGLDIRDVFIPVSIDSNNETSRGPPAQWTTTIRGRIYTPDAAHGSRGPYPLVVYFRSGLILGDLESEDSTCRQISKLARSVVVNVEYRKPPKYKYPTPLQDCWDALQWAARNARSQLGADPQNRGFIVGGTSIGALFATAMAIRARETNFFPPISGQILRSPVTIHPALAASYAGEPLHSHLAKVDYPIHSSHLHQQIFESYGVPDEDTNNPFVSPLLAQSLSGLPPAYFQITGLDLSKDEGLRYEQRLAEAGVQTKKDTYESMPHAFWMYPRLKGAADAARDLISGVQWLEAKSGWDSGVREEVDVWVKDAAVAEGEKAWRERKLCRLEGCDCFM
ncbi:MAG: hypothetical protein M1833_005698 [Piccolia ochrophora]|nr:MAG: hypothetical protein M1833_005698 [Piccolia ochrophora]